MDIVLLILTLPFAGYGAFLIAEHIWWFVKGDVYFAQVVKLAQKKSRGIALPYVSFEIPFNDDDQDSVPQAVEIQTEQIGRWSCFFSRPIEGEFLPVIYKVDERAKARVYGFVNPVMGALLFAPLLAVLAYRYGGAIAQSQFSYALVFAAIMFGGWAALKFIQRS